jgi:hypothetical protein
MRSIRRLLLGAAAAPLLILGMPLAASMTKPLDEAWGPQPHRTPPPRVSAPDLGSRAAARPAVPRVEADTLPSRTWN